MTESTIQVLGGENGDVIVTRQYHDPKKQADAYVFTEHEAVAVSDQIDALLRQREAPEQK